MKLDLLALDLELRRQNLNRTQLAALINKRPTSLSGWVRGIYPPPPGLVNAIERALKLPPGSLRRE